MQLIPLARLYKLRKASSLLDSLKNMLFFLLLLPISVLGQLVSWVPPHAQLINAYVYNATVFTTAVGDKTVYIKQKGLDFDGLSDEHSAAVLYLQSICRFVAVDVLERQNASSWAELWIGDVYCTRDGESWLWLKWLPLRFSAYRGFVDFVNKSIEASTPVGRFVGYIPTGWYLDRLTKTVFKIEEVQIDLLYELRNFYTTVEQLREELKKALAEREASTAALRQTEAKVAALEETIKNLREALVQRESAIRLLQTNLAAARGESEYLRRQLEEARKELEAARRQLEEIEGRLIEASIEAEKWKSMYLQLQTEGGGFDIFIVVVAGAAAAAALLILRRRGVWRT
ncbi:MAG: hypothetical protein QXD96_03655 [Pyrobaculum sp.]